MPDVHATSRIVKVILSASLAAISLGTGGAAGRESLPFSNLAATDSLPVALGRDQAVPLDSASGALAAEPSVAIRDSIIVVSWNDSHGGHINRGFHDVGTAISVDRGNTVRSLGFLPQPSATYLGGGDSRIVVDSKGTFYVVLLVVLVDFQKALLVYALRPPAYASWQFLATIARGKEVVDKPAVFVDPADGLTVAFNLDWVVVHSTSRDGGASWSAPIAVSATVRRHRSGEGVSVCGTNRLVAWMEGGNLLFDEVWSSRSHDGGATFSPPMLEYGLTQAVQPPRGFALGPGPAADLQNDVAVACSPPTWHRKGDILATVDGYRGQTGQPFSRILFFDQAATDSAPPPPFDLTATDSNALRVFPAIATTFATVGVLYYEASRQESRTPVEPILRVRDEAGRSARVRLAAAATDWQSVKGDMEFSPGQHNLGDYISLASDGTQFVAAWTDGREGRSRIHIRVITPR